MKKMILDIPDEEYEKIPSPKRTWVMRVVRAELAGFEPFLEEDLEYAFLLRSGKFKSVKAESKVAAIGVLGLKVDEIERHGTMEEAVRDGWYDVIT